MFKLFFITFFIAELVITLWLITNIYAFDKKVRKWNELVLESKGKIKIAFVDIRSVLQEFTDGLAKLRDFIEQKKEEYMFRFLKTSLVYGSIFMLRGKYKKTVLAYQLVKEIYEGLQED